MKSTNQRRLLVIGGHYSGGPRDRIEYMDLDTMSGMHWANHHLPHAMEWATFVNTDPYQAFLVGGLFDWPGQSTLSWYKWNFDTERFEHVGLDMRAQHLYGDATALPKTAQIINDCYNDGKNYFSINLKQ